MRFLVMVLVAASWLPAAAPAPPGGTSASEDGYTAANAMQTDVGLDGSFSITVGTTVWLKSAPLRAFVEGAWHTTTEGGGGLTRITTAHTTGSGPAPLGRFECTNVTWAIGAKAVVLHTSTQV